MVLVHHASLPHISNIQAPEVRLSYPVPSFSAACLVHEGRYYPHANASPFELAFRYLAVAEDFQG